MNASVQCQKKINGCFCDSVYVKNAVHTDLIVPRTSGGKVSIPALDLAGLECLKLTDTQTAVGCGANGTTGNDNTSVGANALAVATGDNNTGVGADSGVLMTTGSGNTLLGGNVGSALTTGDSNVIVGNLAGSSLISGGQNVMVGDGVGSGASATLTGCVLIGRSVGFLNSTNNRLMIDNSSTSDPLIDGDFSGDTLQVNGTVTLGTDSTTPVHVLNVSEVPLTVENDAGYIRLDINGTIKRVKLYDDVSPP